MASRGRAAIAAAEVFTGGSPMAVNPAYFTGRTVLEDLTAAVGARRCRVYHVRFSAGSTTKIHAHTGDQMLIATRGKGVLSYYRKKGRGSAGAFAIEPDGEVELGSGTMAYIPAGRLHAHGCARGSRSQFSHTAVNFAEDGAEGADMRTVWYESDFERAVTGIVD